MRRLRTIKWFKLLFFGLFVKPIVFIALGLNILNRDQLPQKGPAIIAANHTSHLDALVLMSLFPLKDLHRVRPIAAADYFLKNRWIAWFSKHCLDIVPMRRYDRLKADDLFADCYEALENNQILILFPEGTRSTTEDRTYRLKRGIHYLIEKYPETVVIPVLLRGLGKALPKGEALFVPFNCDVMIDHPLPFDDDSKRYLENLESRYQFLLSQCITK